MSNIERIFKVDKRSSQIFASAAQLFATAVKVSKPRHDSRGRGKNTGRYANQQST